MQLSVRWMGYLATVVLVLWAISALLALFALGEGTSSTSTSTESEVLIRQLKRALRGARAMAETHPCYTECSKNPRCCATSSSGFLNEYEELNDSGEDVCATMLVHCVQECSRGVTYSCDNLGHDPCVD